VPRTLSNSRVRWQRRHGVAYAIHHLKDLLKQKKVAEDEERRAQDDVQKYTDRHIAEIDKLLQQKEADLMAV